MGLLEDASKGLSTGGEKVLGGVAGTVGSILGEDLAGQLFDNYVPLERYTEYQRTYNWEIVFPYLMGNIPGPIVSKYCKAVAFGDYQIEEILKIHTGPKQQMIPGRLGINMVTCVFLVPFPNLVLGYFSEWKKLIVDGFGYYYEQNNYKRSVYVRMYTTQGITSGTVVMKGMFPKSFYDYKLSYESQEVVKYVVTFCLDDIEFTGFDIGSSIPRVLKHLF